MNDGRAGSDRREIDGRRIRTDRRMDVVPVNLERRSGTDRRDRIDRRAGLDRRLIGTFLADV